MVATLIIVFREMIEAGLIIGIVLAATKGVAGSGRWVTYGVLGGLLGACIVAFFAESIASTMHGTGQEIFNASVMIFAVLMLTWHNVWMARTGRHMAAELKSFGEDVSKGARSLAALALVVGVAVLREGSEVVLFLYGIALSGGGTMASMLAGGVMGIVLGGFLSVLMFKGLLRVPTRHIFTVTSWLIALLAAGLAAHSVTYLEQAGVVTIWTNILWDSSALLSEDSLVGKMLYVLVGYTDRPSQMQVVVYVGVLTTIFTLMKLFGHAPKTTEKGK